MNETAQPRLSLWLIPNEADTEALQVTMDKLSDQFSSPKFIPHVTIYSVLLPESQIDDTKKQIVKLA